MSKDDCRSIYIIIIIIIIIIIGFYFLFDIQYISFLYIFIHHYFLGLFLCLYGQDSEETRN